jgi:hypothetical protein
VTDWDINELWRGGGESRPAASGWDMAMTDPSKAAASESSLTIGR